MSLVKKNGYKPANYVKAVDVLDELSKYMLADGYDFVLGLDSSKGSYFKELKSGKKYLDFFTCFASMPIGMNHPKLNNDDFIQYIGRAALNKPSNSDIYTEEIATFVKTFFKIAVPASFKYSFYIEGGALAVENALKTAFDWKIRQNIRNGKGQDKGRKIIHFKEAFHGRSGYTMSLTNTDPNKVKYFPQFDWPRITNPKIEHPINDNSIGRTKKKEEKAVEEIKSAFVNNPDDIAGIIIEPIQGEGGDNHFRPEFLQKLRQLADENEALLIFDEIQTGVGLTGSWWAHEQLGVTPDILCFGKKMQVCGILSTGRVDSEPDNVFHTSSRINSTWGGNLVDMVRATKYLEIIEEEDLVSNSFNMGKKLQNKLNELQNEFSNIISSVRGRGMFCAFDIDKGLRQKFLDECFNEGLIILPCGTKAVRFRPPLNLKESELDTGIGIIKKCLAIVE